MKVFVVTETDDNGYTAICDVFGAQQSAEAWVEERKESDKGKPYEGDWEYGWLPWEVKP